MDDRTATGRKKRIQKLRPERSQNLNFKLKLNKEGVLIDRESDNTVNQFSFQINSSHANENVNNTNERDNKKNKVSSHTMHNDSPHHSERKSAHESRRNTSNNQLFKMNLNYILNIIFMGFVSVILILCVNYSSPK